MKNPVASYFDGWARQYDTDMVRFCYNEPALIQQILAPCLEPLASINLLDIGIGTGLSSAGLASLPGKKVQVWGVDASARMIETCRKKHPAHQLSLCDINTAPLPYQDGGFDVVIAAGVIEYLEDPAHAFAEIARVTAKGGVCAISYEPQETRNHYNGFFLNGVVQESGLKTTIQRLMPRCLLPRTYRKYLYAGAALEAGLEQAGLTITGHAVYTAYTWPGCTGITHGLITCIK